jgi:insecticidal toxin complex protein TccC
LSVIDPRALAIRSVGYCRHPDEVVIEPRITRQMFDEAGRPVASWDPRLWGTAPQPNLATVYGLNGQPVLTKSVDAGWQLSLLNRVGSLHSFWDGRGSQRHCEYDDQQRPVAVTEQGSDALPRVVDRFTYGGADAVDAERNQCGRLIRHDNPASSQITKEYGLAGAVLVESISYLIELETLDWPLDPDARDEWLEDEVFTTRHSFRPTGEIECLTDAMGNVRTFGYDVSGKLSEAWLTLAGEGKQPQRLVSHIRYNALDQIESETAGNGVKTQALYGADDGRLIRLVAAVGSQKPLQDLNYAYDPVGNIVELEDKAQSVSHFNNQRIDPINRYRYDSLYQLIEASGWEVANPSHGPALPALLPTPLDPNQRRNYTQRFDYDAAGNLITRHHSGAPGFSMFTSAHSNRSLAQRDDGSLPGEPDIDSGFDAGGNQRELLRGQVMQWDVRNQLSRVTLVKRINEPDDDECYFYDRPGHRVRKVNVSQTRRRTMCTEVRYLPGLEIHRHADGEEHHVISVEAGRSSAKALHWPESVHADQLRYSLGNHLRSSTLELDAEAGVLTLEYYYAYGGTACWAGKSALVAKYKTVRYSGKERDVTGLYFYGYRYYAAWLQRWLSADPLGLIDGLNLYLVLKNSPMVFYDSEGTVVLNFSKEIGNGSSVVDTRVVIRYELPKMRPGPELAYYLEHFKR